MNKSELFYEEESKTARPHKYSINYKDKNDSVYAIKFYSMQKQIDEKDKEIERLNNIINEIEKYLKEKQALYGINQQRFSWGVAGDCLDKLKELKENNND